MQNQWGGPDSADKRDWLTGVISDLFTNQPNTDAADVEDLLLQVLQDEFGVDLEDESEGRVAESIVKLRLETARGDFGTVKALHADWLKRKEGKGARPEIQAYEQRKDVGSSDGSGREEEEEEEEEDDDDDDGMNGVGDVKGAEDVEMHDAPAGVSSKPKLEVDEDGFTKVVAKKRK